MELSRRGDRGHGECLTQRRFDANGESDHILSQMTRLQEGMSHKRYMELYTVAYNYCTSSRMTQSSADGSSMRCEQNEALRKRHQALMPL